MARFRKFAPVYAFLALALTGCGGPPEPVQLVNVSDLAVSRIFVEDEWRDGRRLSPSGRTRVNVGVLNGATALRFGLLRIGASDNPTATVYVGEREVRSFPLATGPP